MKVERKEWLGGPIVLAVGWTPLVLELIAEKIFNPGEEWLAVGVIVVGIALIATVVAVLLTVLLVIVWCKNHFENRLG